MVIAVVPVQEVTLPAETDGVCPHVIVLVEVAFAAEQPVVLVKVSVAVNEPEVVVGVKVANAGLAFCVHVPDPLPPLHVGVPE
jgi:hypothetical protein